MNGLANALAKRSCAFVLMLGWTCVASAAQPASQNPLALTVCAPRAECLALTADELEAMPQKSISWSDHGSLAQFDGVDVARLLERAGAPVGKALRGQALAHYVVVEAADGYRVVFGLAELEPAVTGRVVLLALRRDGRSMADKEGPFRLVVEGDRRGARSLRRVTAIRVVPLK
jgi:hypothetical protein